MRTTLIALSLVAASLTPSAARAQVHVDVGVRLPSVSIGLALPAFPAMVQVPGQPVYYAPDARANYFYAEDAYWVLRDDRWYSSPWYDGPWTLVAPRYVPSVVLRVPVRYYGRPPVWFSGWHRDASPRWGQHWGHDWERHRAGWDRWDRRQVRYVAPPVARRHDEGRGHDHGRDRWDDRRDDRRDDRGEHHGRGHGREGERGREEHGRGGRR